MRKYLYKNIRIIPYYLGYNTEYRTETTHFLLSVGSKTKAIALKVAREQIDFLNKALQDGKIKL